MKPTPLDTTNFQNLMDRSLTEWKQKTGVKEVHPADVSYTLMETQAFLVDMLNYYMEAVEERHRHSYEVLLGQSVSEKICNEACEQTEPPRKPLLFRCTYNTRYDSLPYTGIQAQIANQEVHLESRTHQVLHPNEILDILYEDAQGIESIKHVLRDVEGDFTLREEVDTVSFHICLKHQLPLHTISAFYVLLKDSEPRVAKKAPFSLGDWCFEIYTQHGWQTLTVEDETNGFLNSGFLRFHIHKRMLLLTQFEEKGYWLRMRGTHLQYDRSPCFQSIWINVLALYPLQTLAKTITIPADAFPLLSFAIPPDALLLLGKEKDGWKRLSFEQRTEECGWRIQPKEKRKTYRVVWQAKELETMDLCDRDITDCSKQQLSLPAFQKLRIGLRQPSGILKDYPLYTTGQRKETPDGCWLFDTTIQFGDGHDFLVPKAMKDGVFFFDLTLSENRFSQFSARSLTFHEPSIQGTLILPYVMETQDAPPSWNLYQKDEIATFTKQLPFVALQEVRVIDRQELHEKKHRHGLCVLCASYRASGEVAPQELAYIKDCLDTALPIGTTITVCSLKQQYVTLYIRLMLYTDSPQIRHELTQSLTAVLTEHLKKRQKLWATEMEAILSQSSYVQRVSRLRFVIDSKQQTEFLPQVDIRYRLSEIQWDNETTEKGG